MTPVLPPTGEFTKHVVREIACSAGLDRIAAKKESMGICFIGKRDFGEFIAQVSTRCANFCTLSELTLARYVGKGHEIGRRKCICISAV